MKEIEVSSTKWLEITPETFTLNRDPCDYSPINIIDLSKDEAVVVFSHLAEFLNVKFPA